VLEVPNCQHMQGNRLNIPFEVPQGAIRSPTLYKIFTLDVPSSEFCRTATFADDTAIFASGQTPLLVQDQLQDRLNEISNYCKDWKIKFNAMMSSTKLFTQMNV
jgi:Reverse transcriptase (RNA-dependent DNA polymerase)